MSAFEGGAPMRVVGHRGGRGEGWPTENTMAAFERAHREGANALELDVRLCGTGEVVVFHDPDLKRMSGGTDHRDVQDVPYIDLANDHRAPMLRDVLAFCNDRRLGLNIEVKYDRVDTARLAREVVRLLDAHRGADVIVSSFDPRILGHLGVMRPETRLALLTTTERRWSLPLARLAARPPYPYAVHLERPQVTEPLVKKLRARGLRIGVWTVNDGNEACALRELGIDWIITDAPGAMLTRTLQERR